MLRHTVADPLRYSSYTTIGYTDIQDNTISITEIRRLLEFEFSVKRKKNCEKKHGTYARMRTAYAP